MATTTSAVYIHVIEDVINKVRDEFVQSGADESVLNELQALWEMKMMHCGAICGPIERSSMPKQPVAGGPITPVHDLNVPYEGTEEYETPTAEILFPPTPLQTPIQTPLPGTAEHSMYNLPTPSEYPVHDTGGATTELKPGRPSPYMQPPSPWMNQRPLGVDVNVAYVEGRDELDRGAPNPNATQDFFTMSSGKRKREEFPPPFHTSGYLPQQDGAGDAIFEVFQSEASHGSSSFSEHGQGSANPEKPMAKVMGASSRIPQQDGPLADGYDDLYPYQGVANEDYNTVTPAGPDLQAGTPIGGTKNEGGDDDDDEPPLNENDDDDLDDIDEEAEEQNTQHLVLAQFDKVTRTKSRWKCQLKDGIMHIIDKDILFTKANGEFDF